MKWCSRCAREKPFEDFYKHARRLDGRQPYCTDCHKIANRKNYEENVERVRARTKQSREELRDEVRSIKEGSPCVDCGESYSFYKMQFDHIADNKDGNIATFVSSGQRKRALAEIAKCELVCANCHAERTWLRQQEGSLRAGLG